MASEEEFLPPLPLIITKTLEKTLFCYLATCEANEPHLSLMNFTYKDNEGIIMSTRTNTKKFQSLINNPSVAILVHDFNSTSSLQTSAASPADPSTSSNIEAANSNNSSSGSCSITVYGKIEVVTDEKAEELRAYHLLKNPKYPQFIVGEDIAIIRIMPTRARICDIRDKVQDWESGRS